MYSCYQTVGACYPPPGLKKQGQVQAMWIGKKTKGPAHLALKIIVETILERGLWPRPLLRLLLFYIIVLLLLAVVFLARQQGFFDAWEWSFLTEITSNGAECEEL